MIKGKRMILEQGEKQAPSEEPVVSRKEEKPLMKAAFEMIEGFSFAMTTGS